LCCRQVLPMSDAPSNYFHLLVLVLVLVLVLRCWLLA